MGLYTASSGGHQPSPKCHRSVLIMIIWVFFNDGGCSCSPRPAEGAVEQQQQCGSGGGGQERAHPEAELAEVTVLDDGQDGGTAEEHGHLHARETSPVNLETPTPISVHDKTFNIAYSHLFVRYTGLYMLLYRTSAFYLLMLFALHYF